MISEKIAQCRRLDAAVADLPLTEQERKTLAWLTRWDAETLERIIASVIEKARSAR